MAFTVLSYNIQEGGGGRLPLIVGVIRGQHPDAVALLEANSRANAEALAHDLGMHLAYGDANSAYAAAWLSRLPIQRIENHRLAVLAKTLLEVEVSWEGAPLRLFATHLASRHDASRPEEEVPAILDVLRPHAHQPHLLTGDLNALRPGDPVGTPPMGVVLRGEARPGTPRRPIGLLVEAGYMDCYWMLHPEAPGYTYPSEAPWLRLDYIFASPRLAPRLAACDVIGGGEARRASDHLPLWAEFA